MLTLWRRHTKECKVREEGRKATHKCDCPVWIDGEVFGKRIRCSTGTRDWARASRRASSQRAIETAASGVASVGGLAEGRAIAPSTPPRRPR